MLKNNFPIGSWVVDLTAERQRHAAFGEGVTDVPSIGHRSSESVELRDNERVVRAYRCQCLIEAGTLAFGAADAVVDVDTIRRNAERVKRLALGGEVSLISRASCVSNQGFMHPRTMPQSAALINR